MMSGLFQQALTTAVGRVTQAQVISAGVTAGTAVAVTETVVNTNIADVSEQRAAQAESLSEEFREAKMPENGSQKILRVMLLTG